MNVEPQISNAEVHCHVAWCLKGSRPLGLIAVFWMAIDCAVLAGLQRLSVNEEIEAETVQWIIACVVGTVIGQFCFAAVVGVLRWRKWEIGYVLHVLATSVALGKRSIQLARVSGGLGIISPLEYARVCITRNNGAQRGMGGEKSDALGR